MKFVGHPTGNQLYMKIKTDKHWLIFDRSSTMPSPRLRAAATTSTVDTLLDLKGGRLVAMWEGAIHTQQVSQRPCMIFHRPLTRTSLNLWQAVNMWAEFLLEYIWYWEIKSKAWRLWRLLRRIPWKNWKEKKCWLWIL